MLFNSFVFMFAYLPVVLGGFLVICRWRRKAAKPWLLLSSLAFYGYWSIVYLPLLLASIAMNYGFGLALSASRGNAAAGRTRMLFALAITANLAILAYFKYWAFLLGSLGLAAAGGKAFIPLGISFFTFTQIAYLADVYAGKAREYDPRDYGLFVTFFPHLIAGPILHHREMMPQFARAATFRLDYANLAVGFTIFFIGMFKKVVCADGIAHYADGVFDAAAGGVHPGAALAWAGVLAYAMQLYFDFSGYSDMAIGLARLFGIRFPANFASPYKARDIAEFWRRWHMTLSRFLRDYLYIPLGGNRRGASRRYVNLMVTMLLGGLWHGAGWTFVLWGGLHGLFLVANIAWRNLAGRLMPWATSAPWGLAARGVTFLAVLVAWVPFRARDMATACSLWKAMAGLMSRDPVLPETIPHLGRSLPRLLALLIVVWLFPNTQQIMRRYRPILAAVPPAMAAKWARALEWRPTAAWLFVILALALLSLGMLAKQTSSDFLYFQF